MLIIMILMSFAEYLRISRKWAAHRLSHYLIFIYVLLLIQIYIEEERLVEWHFQPYLYFDYF